MGSVSQGISQQAPTLRRKLDSRRHLLVSLENCNTDRTYRSMTSSSCSHRCPIRRKYRFLRQPWCTSAGGAPELVVLQSASRLRQPPARLARRRQRLARAQRRWQGAEYHLADGMMKVITGPAQEFKAFAVQQRLVIEHPGDALEALVRHMGVVHMDLKQARLKSL